MMICKQPECRMIVGLFDVVVIFILYALLPTKRLVAHV